MSRSGKLENGCHYSLWNWDEDRCTIRTGHGPAYITALRRFAIGVIKAKSRDTVSATIQRLGRNLRLVFDDLRMTENSRRRPPARLAPVGKNGSAVSRGQPTLVRIASRIYCHRNSGTPKRRATTGDQRGAHNG